MRVVVYVIPLYVRAILRFMGRKSEPDNETLPIVFALTGESALREDPSAPGTWVNRDVAAPEGYVLSQRKLMRREELPTETDTAVEVEMKERLQQQAGRQTEFVPVRRFVLSSRASKRFKPVVQLLSFVRGKPVPQLKGDFRTLVGEAFRLRPPDEHRLTDALSDPALADPKLWSRRWLPALFNREIKGTRMVMWWPEDARSFSPAIYCKDEETALFVSLLFRGVELCPGCGQPFIRRRKQRFHNRNCGQRLRQALYREQQKQRRKKGKSRGTN
jgi:hypothetical protein